MSLTPQENQEVHDLLLDFLSGGDEESLDKAFTLLDKDGSGKLDPSELKQFYSQEQSAQAQQKMKQILESMDTNKDGLVDLDEFKKKLQKMASVD